MLESKDGVDLLKSYADEWTRYKEKKDIVDGLFVYLNRHWIAREVNERSSTTVFTIQNVST